MPMRLFQTLYANMTNVLGDEKLKKQHTEKQVVEKLEEEVNNVR